MGQALQVSITLTEMNCGECGGTYAINERYRQQKYDKSGFWTCPYCKCSWGYEKSQIKKLEEERDAEIRRHQATLARLNQTAAEKDKLARKLKRVDRGVCPECNRTFQNLGRHMACKHAK